MTCTLLLGPRDTVRHHAVQSPTPCLCCSLNDLPYEGWPLRGPQSAEEAAREDALSRRLRVTLQRPMLLATQASNVAALSAADRKAAVSQLGALHGFACAARNEGWAKGNLPIVFQLQYVPRECGRSVRNFARLRDTILWSNAGLLPHGLLPHADHLAADRRRPLRAARPGAPRPH